jgi:hypothetical protein
VRGHFDALGGGKTGEDFAASLEIFDRGFEVSSRFCGRFGASIVMVFGRLRGVVVPLLSVKIEP